MTEQKTGDINDAYLERLMGAGAVSRPGTSPQEFTPRDTAAADRAAAEILGELSTDISTSTKPTASDERRLRGLALVVGGEPENDEERALVAKWRLEDIRTAEELEKVRLQSRPKSSDLNRPMDW